MPATYINGELLEDDAATISVRDHGLVVGDGVFETILISAGQPFALRRHLDRLERSLAGLLIEGVERKEVERAIALVCASERLERGRLRLTVTSGRGPLGSSRGGERPSIVVSAEPALLEPPTCRVAVMDFTRNEHGALTSLKTTSYAENALALELAHHVGADEAIFANTAGMLCEGTGSNVFVVIDGALITPPLSSGCLAGTTRELLIEHGFGSEATIPIEQFSPRHCEEAFIASSVRGVQAIAAIGSEHFAHAPGPVTEEAMAFWADLLKGNADP
jgi:branched-chain amino acid aminotransferase